MKPRRVALHTHQNVAQTGDAVGYVVSKLLEAGVEVIAPQEEVEKHAVDGLKAVPDPVGADPDVVVVLGGDGTMLAALRDYAETDAVVFSFNFGAVGFLATVEGDRLEDGIRRILESGYEVLAMPTLGINPSGGHRIAVNDVTFLRRSGARVAELAYLVRGQELATARCDGLVVSTPVGSTGYNLANGGPVVAWGVEGYVVSYIAPHTLTNRTLVAAAGDVLVVRNLSREEPVDVYVDGRPVCTLASGEDLEVRSEDRPARLAQVAGSGFYEQLARKFGRLVG